MVFKWLFLVILRTDYTVSSRRQTDSFDIGEVTLSADPIKDNVSVSHRGLLAFVKSGFSMPPEVFAMNGSTHDLMQLTHLNTGVHSTARKESIEWASDSFHVQGWLIYPAHYDPKKKYPLIVTVHGGPSASVGASFSGEGTTWADAGYFELQPNPRGSFGQGEEFAAANRKDLARAIFKTSLRASMQSRRKSPSTSIASV